MRSISAVVVFSAIGLSLASLAILSTLDTASARLAGPPLAVIGFIYGFHGLYRLFRRQWRDEAWWRDHPWLAFLLAGPFVAVFGSRAVEIYGALIQTLVGLVIFLGGVLVIIAGVQT